MDKRVRAVKQRLQQKKVARLKETAKRSTARCKMLEKQNTLLKRRMAILNRATTRMRVARKAYCEHLQPAIQEDLLRCAQEDIVHQLARRLFECTHVVEDHTDKSYDVMVDVTVIDNQAVINLMYQ